MEKATYKEHGVVLHSTKYSEGQLIVHLLTAAHGRQSYITRLGRSTARANSLGAGRGLFQPLFVLDFVAEQGRGELHKMSQVTLKRQLTELPFDIVKSSISIFISELLYRLIPGREPHDERLYGFVEESIVALDAMQGGVSNFHLHFMVRLMYYLGIAPNNRYQEGAWLDIKAGKYTLRPPQHTMLIAPEIAATVHALSRLNVMQLDQIKLRQADRVQIMNALVDYFHFHTDAIRTVRSIAILGELF